MRKETRINDADTYYPFVSIALTTFNGKAFLKEQIDSIINQTYKNFELVISDDDSDEETLKILNYYVKIDKRVKLFKSPLARGFINNSQYAIKMCSGDIIFLCDQDDIWYLDKIQLHVDAYADDSIDWAYNKLVLTDENNNKLGYFEDVIPNYYSKKRMGLLSYTWGNCIGGALTSYRSEIIKAAMPVGFFALAHDSWIQLHIFPKKSFFIDKVLQTYRQHSGNIFGFNEVQSNGNNSEKRKKAIVQNINFLKYLPRNKHLQPWKRLFFLFIYYIKLIRYKIINILISLNLGVKNGR